MTAGIDLPAGVGGGKVGNFKAGTWALIIGGGAAAGFILRRYFAAKAPAAAVADPLAAPFTYTPAGGNAGATSGSDGTDLPAVIPATNLDWSRKAIAILIGLGVDPAIADSAIRKYLNGDQLNAAETAAVKLALATKEIGVPPEYVPPPLYYTATVDPQTTTTTVRNPDPPPVVTPTVVTPPAAAQHLYYTVNPGDSLWHIAELWYHDGSQWPRIYEANRDQISNPNLIYPGQVLIIP